jgi:hypothetical protein
MSVYQNLFIGPFAEFLVPEGKTEGLPPEDEGGDRLFYEKLLCNVGLGAPETTVRGKKRYHRFCYMPHADKPEAHGRPMYFGGQPAYPAIQDLLKVDRQAEVDRFAKAFAKELKALAEKFGGKPRLSWGLVCWPS